MHYVARSADRVKLLVWDGSGLILARDDAAPGRLVASLPALDQKLGLIVTMDDATSAIYSAFLVDEEGTLSTFRRLPR